MRRRFLYFTPIVFQKIGYVVFSTLYTLFVRLHIEGKEHLEGLSGPIILAPNHTHELDATVVPLVLPFFSALYPIYFVANQTEKYKTLGWRSYLYGGFFFNILGGYAVYSGHKDYAKALEDHIELLEQGHTLCIFPEGKRTRDGHLNPARGGMGYLVHRTGATVVPIAIDTFFNMSILDFFGRHRRVTIRVLPPLTRPDLFTTLSPEVEDYRHAGDIVLDKIRHVLEN